MFDFGQICRIEIIKEIESMAFDTVHYLLMERLYVAAAVVVAVIVFIHH